MTAQRSFDEIRTFHAQILRVKDRDAYPMVLVGNKCDMDDKRVVSTQAGKDLARDLSIDFLETSAKQRINVDLAFHTLVRAIRRYEANNPRAAVRDSKAADSRCHLL